MFEILVVEDNAGDVDLIMEALRDTQVQPDVKVASDGIVALDMLRQLDTWATGRPDLILLDLNLPKKSGLDVLAEIKGDQSLSEIPVVIVSSSEAETDVLRAYKLYANCYVKKPLNFDQFISTFRSIEQFWLTVVKLPPKGR